MKNIILIGPQGSGKGTQANNIIHDYDVHHIEMGELIRARADEHDKKGEIIDHLANKKGILLPDGVILDMIIGELEEHPNDNGYLFDGFPRTTQQFDALHKVLDEKNMTITHAFYLHISDEVALHRLSHRYICATCHKSIAITDNNVSMICACGGELIKRSDDNPKAIQTRLSSFHKNTEPILEKLKSHGLLTTINAEQTIDKVYEEIRSYL